MPQYTKADLDRHSAELKAQRKAQRTHERQLRKAEKRNLKEQRRLEKQKARNLLRDNGYSRPVVMFNGKPYTIETEEYVIEPMMVQNRAPYRTCVYDRNEQCEGCGRYR